MSGLFYAYMKRHPSRKSNFPTAHSRQIAYYYYPQCTALFHLCTTVLCNKKHVCPKVTFWPGWPRKHTINVWAPFSQLLFSDRFQAPSTTSKQHQRSEVPVASLDTNQKFILGFEQINCTFESLTGWICQRHPADPLRIQQTTSKKISATKLNALPRLHCPHREIVWLIEECRASQVVTALNHGTCVFKRLVRG